MTEINMPNLGSAISVKLMILEICPFTAKEGTTQKARESPYGDNMCLSREFTLVSPNNTLIFNGVISSWKFRGRLRKSRHGSMINLSCENIDAISYHLVNSYITEATQIFSKCKGGIYDIHAQNFLWHLNFSSSGLFLGELCQETIPYCIWDRQNSELPLHYW